MGNVSWFARRVSGFRMLSSARSARTRPARRARSLHLEPLEDRLCLTLGLTQAGRDEGIGISVFAGDFPMIGVTGPIGIAFPDTGGVLVSDYPGNVRLFPHDADGQSATWFPPGQNYGSFNAFGLAKLDGAVYMAQQSQGRLVQLNDDGTLNHVVVSGLGFAEGVVADPAGDRLFVSTGAGIMTVDPVAQTASLFVNVQADGLLLSADGGTLFAAQNDNHVKGYDTTTGEVVFDAGRLSGVPDGLVEGTRQLAGNLFINTNSGTIVQVNEATLTQTVVASGGSRGDFAAIDPNDGSALFTQTDRIVRLTFPAAQSGNLIVNGDFEQGNVGFTSDYQFSTTDAGPGYYGVVSDPRMFNGELASFGDHTTGSGLMMAVDGALVPGQVVWSETVAVDPGTDFHFEAWVASNYPASPAVLNFRFNGQSVGVFTAPTQTGVWATFGTIWSSGANTSATIQIIDDNTAFSGNDFSLDDLSLLATNPQPVGPPRAGMLVGQGASLGDGARTLSQASGQEIAPLAVLDSHAPLGWEMAFPASGAAIPSALPAGLANYPLSADKEMGLVDPLFRAGIDPLGNPIESLLFEGRATAAPSTTG